MQAYKDLIQLVIDENLGRKEIIIILSFNDLVGADLSAKA